MFATLCVALATVTSNAFGVVILRDISPKYVAEHKNEFRVATAMRNGNVEFRITRFLQEARHCNAEIVIRKGGHKVVACQLLPTKDKSRVSYVFTVSPEYVSESDFFLWEGRLGEFTVIGADNTKVTTVEPDFADVRFRFPLRDFANSVGDSK
jgi:hypothetical protein